jgi:signal transduction histidine kinase
MAPPIRNSPGPSNTCGDQDVSPVDESQSSGAEEEVIATTLSLALRGRVSVSVSVEDSSDNANPTGTATAATIAARRTTRNLFRICGGKLQSGCHARDHVNRALFFSVFDSFREQRSEHIRLYGTAFPKLGGKRPSSMCYARHVEQSGASSTIVDDYTRLLSLAVHEFRTPASVVNGYLRMLLTFSEPPLGDKQKKMVEEAEKSCARLVALIAELSEISKLDAGTASVTAEEFDVFRIVGEVAEGVQEGRDRGVQFEARGSASGAPLRGDLDRLRKAFLACFRAIAREQIEAVTVVADRQRVSQPDTDSAVIVVTTQGNVQRAYDAAPGPFDEKRGGLGLSLPIARRVIERHGGRLSSPTEGPPAIVIRFPLQVQRS